MIHYRIYTFVRLFTRNPALAWRIAERITNWVHA